MMSQYAHVDLPAKDERKADVEREVELVDVVKFVKNHRDGHFGGPWRVVRAVVADARVESYRA